MRILLLNVFAGETYELENCRKWARPDVDVEFTTSSDYPLEHVYYAYYQFRAADEVAKRIVEAERSGFDAAVICCMADPGLYEARQLVDIPVVGIYEASAHMAHMAGYRYSIVTITRDLVPVMDALATKYGVRDRLASIRHIDVPAWELYPGRTPDEVLVDRTIAAAQECIDKDYAEAIIMGGSLSAAMVTKAIEGGKELLPGIPVIDPVLAAFKTAEMLADMRQHGARVTSRAGMWASPPQEDLDKVLAYQAGTGHI